MLTKIFKITASVLCVAMMAFLITTTDARAEDSDVEEGAKIRITPQFGVVRLTGKDSDFLDDSLGFGITGTYTFRKPFFCGLSVLYSMHKGKNLPEGFDLDLSILSVTPVLGVIAEGDRLDYWLAGGIGPTFLKTSVDGPGNVEGTQSETATGVRVGAGVDYKLFDRFTFGVEANYHTATSAVDDSVGNEKEAATETSIYFSYLARFTYKFKGKVPQPKPKIDPRMP